MAPGPTGLRITRVLARRSAGRSETSLHPDLRVFVSDLVRPYGLPLREDLLGEGVGHSYEELAAGPLREALAEDEPADLLILAFDTPDVRPGAPSSLALSRSVPGSPLSFAVCDQGGAAAFTALRLAAAHQRTGTCRRAVVVLAEQSALHYEPSGPVPLPERHAVVVLVCEEAPGDGLAVRQTRGEASPAEAVRAEAEKLGPETALLLGPGFGAGEPPPAQPFTGLWAELADHLPRWRADGRPALLAGYDRRLGVLSTLALP
ncbi:hypothetical protein DR950_40945 [Kitasatospora xanthocidica]|uniref:2-hydroxy-acid oxidase n=1 Tax=Kitasatospora xanthocidica TaxID=83382 RepID=A0A372ZIM0_9ACTN|nr:hypothetical protein [Kitasatospora xanthocidica]RGD55698.1 hypothetical protein DR950_40945 [Kitasatospora xanthocidica]